MAMEISNGVVVRTRPGLCSGSRIDPRPRVSVRVLNRIPCEFNFPESKLCARSMRRRVVGESSAFGDKRHMEYYNCCSGPTSGEERNKEKMKKKKMKAGVSEKKRNKLVKDLAKNLYMFSELGFGLESDEAKVKAISEAALVLQAHLEHLKEDGKKLKKEGKMTTAMDDSESSSSSSESSDSECDNDEVVNMSTLRNQVAVNQIVEESIRSELHETMPTSPIEAVGVVGVTIHNLDTSGELKRVEVCMGKKCTKMGAPVLMEEFRNVLGVEGSVVECKCLGKCKTAPNVRIVNSGEDDVGEVDDSVRSPRNPLCLGVGLDDVGFIVANYFGSEQKQVGLGVSLDSAASPSASYL